METPELTSIDAVIVALDRIIESSIREGDPLGYFAVLYRRVTWKVKEGIEAGFFDDGERMERLDIVFAKRYLDAYQAHRQGRPVTQSWARAFDLGTDYWPVVLQHLLIGINAHINLDLGIASVDAARRQPIEDLQNDFNKINEVLGALVEEVQGNLSKIWPRLRDILLRTKQIDNHIVDFSMEIARNGAWTFAQELARTTPEAREAFIAIRDEKIAAKAQIITGRGWVAKFATGVIRLREMGSVADKLRKLQGN